MTHKNAFALGRSACRNENKTAVDCPFKPGDRFFNSWNAGYGFQFWL